MGLWGAGRGEGGEDEAKGGGREERVGEGGEWIGKGVRTEEEMEEVGS